MSFVFTPLSISGVVLVEARIHEDERGHFMECYRESAFATGGIPARFVQDNRSLSRRGVLRGLHYQRPPHSQGKLVSVLRGEIHDVAVDLRPASPTFGRWVAARLTAADARMLYIPEGFAHGFQVLSDEALVCYKTTAEYAPRSDTGIRWDDPDLAIPWPIDPPVLSPKDRSLPTFGEASRHLAPVGG